MKLLFRVVNNTYCCFILLIVIVCDCYISLLIIFT